MASNKTEVRPTSEVICGREKHCRGSFKCTKETREKTKERPKIEWTTESLQRLLADAISYKYSLNDIEVILRCGGKVNEEVQKGLLPLHYASYVNYSECVKLLIEKGANVNVTDNIGYTPLHLCARHGYFDSMKILINNGAILNYCESTENNSEVEKASQTLGYLTHEPLNMAIENNHVDCVRLLLESGAKPNNKYFMGYEINLVPLDNLECLKILLQHGGDPNAFNRCGLTPLMKACREDKIEAVKMLLENGADVNVQCPPRFDQKTPLHFAICGGSYSVVRILLENEAKVIKPPDYKFCPLHAAVQADRPDLCTLLLQWKADVNSRTDDYSTPLMFACALVGLKHRKEIIQTLLEYEADVNAHSPYVSYTDPCLSPLAEYLKNNTNDVDDEVIQLLVKYGAKVTFRGDTTVFRLKDPFGILNYVSDIGKPTLAFLLDAAEEYDKETIMRSDILLPADKENFLFYGDKPRELKHLVRLYLRRLLQTTLPSRISELPLPALIKSYLLFEI